MSVCLSGSPSVDQLSVVRRAELEQFIILPAKTEVNQIEIKEQKEGTARGREAEADTQPVAWRGGSSRGRGGGAGEIEQCSMQ